MQESNHLFADIPDDVFHQCQAESRLSAKKRHVVESASDTTDSSSRDDALSTDAFYVRSGIINKHIPQSKLSKRAGPGGRSLLYAKTDCVMEALNTHYPERWSFSIMEVTDISDPANDEYAYLVTGQLTIVAENGKERVHQDVGGGSSKGGGGRMNRVDAIIKARKAAVSDAIKRCARQCGNAFGCNLGETDM